MSASSEVREGKNIPKEVHYSSGKAKPPKFVQSQHCYRFVRQYVQGCPSRIYAATASYPMYTNRLLYLDTNTYKYIHISTIFTNVVAPRCRRGRDDADGFATQGPKCGIRARARASRVLALGRVGVGARLPVSTMSHHEEGIRGTMLLCSSIGIKG